MQDSPTLVLEFMADLGGDPETYGSPDVMSWGTATEAELGKAFVEGFVEPIRRFRPELLPELADVDLCSLDFGAIGNEVKRSVQDPSAWM